MDYIHYVTNLKMNGIQEDEWEVWAGATGGEAGETGWEGGETEAGETGGEEGAGATA